MTRYTHRRRDLLTSDFYIDREQTRKRHRANLYLDGGLFTIVRKIAVAEEASLSTVLRELVQDGLAARNLTRAAPTGAGASK